MSNSFLNKVLVQVEKIRLGFAFSACYYTLAMTFDSSMVH